MCFVKGKRRGGVVMGALAVALLALTGIGIYMKSGDSEIEREALQKARQLANDPSYRGTSAQAGALENLDAEERAFRLAEGQRAMEIIGGAVGGTTGDVIEFVNMADEAITEYFEEQYRGEPSVMEMERFKATGQAMTRYIRKRKVPRARALTDNPALIAEMVRHYDEAAVHLGREETREYVRAQYPELRELADDQLLAKWLEPRIAAEVERAADGYQRLERKLAEAGVKVTPELVNSVLSDAIRKSRASGDFTAALDAAIVDATKLLTLDGRYSGAFAGMATGTCTVEISGPSVSIRLSGGGANVEGPFSATVTGVGRIDRETGAIAGSSLYGTVKNKWGTHEVQGSFQGSAGNNQVVGQWTAASRALHAAGSFVAKK